MCSCLNTTDQREKLFCPFRFSRLTLVLYYLSSHCFMSGNYYDLQVLCLMRFSMMVVVSIHRGLKDEKTSSTYIYCNIFLMKNWCKFSYFTGHTKLLGLFQKPRAISKYVCKTSLSWHYKVHSRFQFFTYCVYSWRYKVP